MNTSTNVQVTSAGFGLATLIVVVLAVLKVANVIELSWWWVVSPWVISFAFNILFLAVVLIFVAAVEVLIAIVED